MPVEGLRASLLIPLFILALGVTPATVRAQDDLGSCPPVPHSGCHDEEPAFEQSGIASWYGPGFHGRRTASGVRFDQNAMTAAHKHLRMGITVTVVNEETGRMIEVLINDRGPYIDGRIIDLSRRAAEELGIEEQGIAKVRIAATDRQLGLTPPDAPPDVPPPESTPEVAPEVPTASANTESTHVEVAENPPEP